MVSGVSLNPRDLWLASPTQATAMSTIVYLRVRECRNCGHDWDWNRLWQPSTEHEKVDQEKYARESVQACIDREWHRNLVFAEHLTGVGRIHDLPRLHQQVLVDRHNRPVHDRDQCFSRQRHRHQYILEPAKRWIVQTGGSRRFLSAKVEMPVPFVSSVALVNRLTFWSANQVKN